MHLFARQRPERCKCGNKDQHNLATLYSSQMSTLCNNHLPNTKPPTNYPPYPPWTAVIQSVFLLRHPAKPTGGTPHSRIQSFPSSLPTHVFISARFMTMKTIKNNFLKSTRRKTSNRNAPCTYPPAMGIDPTEIHDRDVSGSRPD